MKLYGAIASPYVARVVMFARLKGIELEMAGMPGGSPRSPEFLAVNPIGKIPSFEAGGRHFPESEVICEYLEDAAGGKSAMPADPLDRATSRLISRIVDLYLAPQASAFFRQMNPATRDAKAVEAAAAELAKAFGYIEHFMGPGPFAVGATPTVGDCALAPHVALIKQVVFANFGIADPTEADGRLGRWWQAIRSDEVCARTVDEYATALAGFMKAMAGRG